MAGNFGIGFGAFMQGAAQGAQLAQSIKRNDQLNTLTDMKIKDLQRENDAQQGARDLAAQGTKDAQTNTDGQINNVMDYYMKNTAPKLQQYWMSNGEVDKANAFGKWIQDSNVQQGMRYGAGMIRAAQAGDPQGVMDNMVKMYNQPGYFEDGMSAVNASLTKNDKGEPSGMEITLRNDRTGEETKHKFNSMADVYSMATQFGSPDQVFKYGMDQLSAGQKTQAELAKEERAWQRDNAKAERQQGFTLESQNNASQLRRAEKAEALRNPAANKKVQDAKATIAFLKENGAGDDFIKKNLPSIIGIENRSRPMSSRIDDYIKMRSGNDTKFNRKPLDEQISEARNYISQVDSLTGETDGYSDDGEADGGDAAGGMSLGLPGANTTQPQQGNGILFFDTKTGKIISR